MERSPSRVRDEPAPEWVALENGIHARLMVEGNGSRITLYRLDPGSRFPQHSHPFPELGVLLIGRGRLLIGDEVRAVREGDSFYTPGGTPHGFEVDADGPVVTLNVTVPLLPEMDPASSSTVHRSASKARD